MKAQLNGFKVGDEAGSKPPAFMIVLPSCLAAAKVTVAVTVNEAA